MFNKVILLGRLTREPNEKRITTVAVDGGKDKDGNTHTDFIPVILSAKLFESIGKYLTKGKLILVEGSLKSYKDKNNHEQLIVSVRNIQLLGGSKSYEGSKKNDSSSSGGDNDPIFD